MSNEVRDRSSRQTPQRTGDPVRVLTVDDQAVFRRVADDVIAATLGFEAIGEAECGEDAVAAVAKLQPDLVLLDLRMPGIGGIEAARRITAANPDTVVILITIQELDEFSDAVRGSGAAALVRKQDFGPDLLRRIWNEYGHRQ